MNNDKECIEFYDQNLKGKGLKIISLNKQCPEFLTYIRNRFTDTDGTETVKELIYRIENKLEEIPKCPVCGKPLTFYKRNWKYKSFCSDICKNSVKGKKIIQQKSIKTNIEKYGCNVGSQSEKVKEKMKQTCLKKYGADCSLKNKNIKDKAIKTWLINYGVDHPNKSERIQEHRKQTCLEKYGVEHPQQNTEIMLRAFNARIKSIKGKIFSKKEDEIYNYLITLDENTKRQYYSELYPFHCDFYLPKFDVYIEYQGMWTHGKHPFNKDDENDIALLETWELKAKNSKFYNSAIKNWTITDPLKRKTAKDNNLKYLEIFSTDSYKDVINSYLKI